ncbi:hypothetical protein [Nitratireductor sp.]|uniref:hypothetical protein n=1 Tax=Nitratireductor sp. TaxID=1872084 RepID=UPI002605FB74|nr:hypothetical protein [Nitratireductor sp.]MCV0381742.1 hypothetical protein [Nitratireductor sp.]
MELDEAKVEEIVCHVVGRNLHKSGDPYSRFTSEAKAWWKGGRRSPPPFTALLFCLAHAAELMAADGDFAANNYYERLAQVTRRERQSLSFHGRSTELFWDLLNSWLVDNNFELGRPTAKAVNSWKYVGKALSQVVVRAGDREIFHDLFERYGFSGNEPISVDEIRHYLSNWMHMSKPNARLKAAWRKPELQGRVCESAIAELAAWGAGDDGEAAGPRTNARRSAKLSLIANIVPRFPRSFLDIQIGQAGEKDRPIGPLHVEGLDQEFTLSNSQFGTFATIEPRPIGSDGEVLNRGFSLSTCDQATSYSWQPRLVIPFGRSPDGPYWIEVARVAFGMPHLVLVRDFGSMVRDLEAYFAEAAIEMPTVAHAAELPGVPEGWILYKDVRLGHPSSEPRKDFEALVPLGEDGALLVNGTFQLARGIYHAGSTIRASLVASSGPTEIRAVEDGAPGTHIVAANDDGRACNLDIPLRSVVSGHSIHLEGYRKGKLIDRSEFLVRDSSTPRPLDRQDRGLLSYRSILGSADGSTPATGMTVVGTVVAGEADCPAVPEAFDQQAQLPVGNAEADQEFELSRSIVIHSGRETCVQRGHHYWICESLKPEMPKKTPLRQQCKDCGQSVIIVDRGKKTARPTVPGRSIGKYQPVQKLVQDQIDHALLLDALCFLGCGSWGKFEALLSDQLEEPWKARSIAEDLFLLGFLDLDLRTGSNAIRRWSVPPPAINYIDDSTAFLSGFRCEALETSIADAATRSGCRFSKQEIAGRPPLIKVSGIDPRQAVEVFSGVQDPLGRPISIVDAAGKSLARACASFLGLFDSMSPIDIGDVRNLQAFDAKKARWIDASHLGGPGAYRWNDGVQMYAYRWPDGVARRGPYQIVKLLAAREQNVRLHEYDEGSRALKATLGCDVPGLLGRALVCCSGDLPAIRDGVLSYENVGPVVAADVINMMYGGNEWPTLRQ